MRLRLLLSALLVACAPAAPTPKAAPAPKPVAKAPPPKPGAKWSFTDARGETHAQIDLGVRGVLQVGADGRRWLIAKSGVKQASTLVAEDLVDVREAAPLGSGKVLLLGRDGTTFVADEPLGPIVAKRAAPKGSLLSVGAGKQALLALDKDGSLHRSLDEGVTWSATKLPLRALEEPFRMATTRNGDVAVLVVPQRVLLSKDDGATWTTATTPGFGATDLIRDGHEELWLKASWTVGDVARLLPSPPHFEISTSSPAELLAREENVTGEDVVARAQLAGDRVVYLTRRALGKSHVRIDAATAPFGQAPPPPSPVFAEVNKSVVLAVGGDASSVVVTVSDSEADPPATVVRRSSDEGKTWSDLGTIEAMTSVDRVIVAGTTVVVTGWCNGARCTQKKTADAPFVENGSPTGNESIVAYDPVHQRLFRASADGSGTAGSATLETLDGKVVAEQPSLPRGQYLGASFDDKGRVRLLLGGPARVLLLEPDLALGPELHLPFGPYDVAVSLAGLRGFADAPQGGFETNDGGAHWVEVGRASHDRDLHCSAPGCVNGTAVRSGWELPESGLPEGAIASTADPMPTSKPSVAPPPVTTVKLTCTPSTATKKAHGIRPNISIEGEPRVIVDNVASVSVVQAGKVQELALLGVPKPPKSAPNAPTPIVRQQTAQTAGGVISAWYAFQPKQGGGYQPVDVELGWYSTVTGKVGHAKIDKVPPFRVGNVTPSAFMMPVDGGALFLPLRNTEAPLYFAHDDGKVETLTRPPLGTTFHLDTGYAIGKQILLAGASFSDLLLVSTYDRGKTWTVATWTMGGDAKVVRAGDRLAVLDAPYGAGDAPRGIAPLTAITPDPPEFRLLDAAAFASPLAACAPKLVAYDLAFYREVGLPRVVATLIHPGKENAKEAPKELTSIRRVVRITEDGKVCTSMLNLSDESSHEAFIFPGRPKDDLLLSPYPKDFQYLDVRSLACTNTP